MASCSCLTKSCGCPTRPGCRPCCWTASHFKPNPTSLSAVPDTENNPIIRTTPRPCTLFPPPFFLPPHQPLAQPPARCHQTFGPHCAHAPINAQTPASQVSTHIAHRCKTLQNNAHELSLLETFLSLHAVPCHLNAPSWRRRRCPLTEWTRPRPPSRAKTESSKQPVRLPFCKPLAHLQLATLSPKRLTCS